MPIFQDADTLTPEVARARADLPRLLRERAALVLRAFARHGHLVLGTGGAACSAPFPPLVAAAFRELLGTRRRVRPPSGPSATP